MANERILELYQCIQSKRVTRILRRYTRKDIEEFQSDLLMKCLEVDDLSNPKLEAFVLSVAKNLSMKKSKPIEELAEDPEEHVEQSRASMLSLFDTAVLFVLDHEEVLDPLQISRRLFHKFRRNKEDENVWEGRYRNITDFLNKHPALPKKKYRSEYKRVMNLLKDMVKIGGDSTNEKL